MPLTILAHLARPTCSRVALDGWLTSSQVRPASRRVERDITTYVSRESVRGPESRGAFSHSYSGPDQGRTEQKCDIRAEFATRQPLPTHAGTGVRPGLSHAFSWVERQMVPRMIAPIPKNLVGLALSPRKMMPTIESAAITTALHTAYATDVSSARRDRLKP